MLANVSSNDLAVLRISLCQDPLDQVIAILVAGNIDQWNTGSVDPAFTNSIQVTAQKIPPSDLEAFLNYLGGVLIHTVLGSESNDMVDSSAAVCWGAMLADVLNAPIAKLAVGDDVNIGKDFLDARPLSIISMKR